MGVDIRTLGRLLELRFSGSVAGRDAITWADELRSMIGSCGAPIFVLTVFERGMKIATSDFAAACRASMSLQPSIGGVAMVTPLGFERMLARVGVAVTNPPFKVGFFEEPWLGRDWLLKLADTSHAA